MLSRMGYSDPPLIVSVGGLMQRFYSIKPCPKEMKCDVEVSSVSTFFFLAFFKLIFCQC